MPEGIPGAPVPLWSLRDHAENENEKHCSLACASGHFCDGIWSLHKNCVWSDSACFQQ